MMMRIEKICIKNNPERPELGIHIIADYDPERDQEEALLVQGIKPGGRIARDGRLEVGDRIEEINEVSLLGIDFAGSQEIFRQALTTPELRLRVVKNFIDKRFIPPPVSETYPPPSSISPPPSSDSANSRGADSARSKSISDSDDFDLTRTNNTINNSIYSYSNSHDNDAKSCLVIPNERLIGDTLSKQASITSTKKVQHGTSSSTTVSSVSSSTPSKVVPGSLLAVSNTRKMGKRHIIELVKLRDGLGFSVTTRDNPAGGNCPIYIKTILTYGSAVQDGRLRPGDRLLEVNGTEMTGKTQDEAVQILRNIPVGGLAKLIVSRQESDAVVPIPSPKTPRVLPVAPSVESLATVNVRREELLTFEIPLNDTQSAGLGFSVKGKQTNSGIFVLQIFNGGAAKKDGRLKPNDQILEINGISLVGLQNTLATETLRRAMTFCEGPKAVPNAIVLAVRRKVSSSPVKEANKAKVHSSQGDEVSARECERESSARAERNESLPLSDQAHSSRHITSDPSQLNEQLASLSLHHQDEHCDTSAFSPSLAGWGAGDNTIIHVGDGDDPPSSRMVTVNGVGIESNETTPPRQQTRQNGSPTDLMQCSSQLSLHDQDGDNGFRRDGFGRQSMSEKRHAQLDAKSTDTFQRSKRAKEERLRALARDPDPLNSNSYTVSHINNRDLTYAPAMSPDAELFLHADSCGTTRENLIEYRREEETTQPPEEYNPQRVTPKRGSRLFGSFSRSVPDRISSSSSGMVGGGEWDSCSGHDEATSPFCSLHSGRRRASISSSRASRERVESCLAKSSLTSPDRDGDRPAKRELLARACCWKCGSPGSCTCQPTRGHARVATLRSSSLANQQKEDSSNGPNNQTPNGYHSSRLVPRSSSLESLQIMLQTLQREQLDECKFVNKAGRSATVRVGRTRLTNDSFRAAVEQRVGQGLPHGHGAGEHEMQQVSMAMEPLSEDFPSDEPTYSSFIPTMVLMSRSMEQEAPQSTQQQSRAFHQTRTASTLSTPPATTSDEDHGLLNSKKRGSMKEKKRGGIFNAFLRFGSGKRKSGKSKGKVAPSELSSVDDARTVTTGTGSISEMARAKEFVRQEHERINKHYERLVRENSANGLVHYQNGGAYADFGPAHPQAAQQYADEIPPFALSRQDRVQQEQIRAQHERLTLVRRSRRDSQRRNPHPLDVFVGQHSHPPVGPPPPPPQGQTPVHYSNAFQMDHLLNDCQASSSQFNPAAFNGYHARTHHHVRQSSCGPVLVGLDGSQSVKWRQTSRASSRPPIPPQFHHPVTNGIVYKHPVQQHTQLQQQQYLVQRPAHAVRPSLTENDVVAYQMHCATGGRFPAPLRCYNMPAPITSRVNYV